MPSQFLGIQITCSRHRQFGCTAPGDPALKVPSSRTTAPSAPSQIGHVRRSSEASHCRHGCSDASDSTSLEMSENASSRSSLKAREVSVAATMRTRKRSLAATFFATVVAVPFVSGTTSFAAFRQWSAMLAPMIFARLKSLARRKVRPRTAVAIVVCLCRRRLLTNAVIDRARAICRPDLMASTNSPASSVAARSIASAGRLRRITARFQARTTATPSEASRTDSADRRARRASAWSRWSTFAVAGLLRGIVWLV